MGDIEEDMTCDLCELLASNERDFLIRNNGDQVKISSLIGGNKMVGIYSCKFESDPWCREYFTPLLVKVYREIASSKGHDFEMVMLSLDEDEESFNAHFAQMPWLAVPHEDSEEINNNLEGIIRYPISKWNLTIVDKSRKILFRDAIKTVRHYGAEAYPFSRERMLLLKEEEALARQNQSITSLLGNDHLIVCGTTGRRFPVSQLVGKTVALYFQGPYTCEEFNDLVAHVYKQLKDKGEDFEVVYASNGNGSHECFDETIKSMPWLALPLRDIRADRLLYYFYGDPDLRYTSPTIYIIGPDGKTLKINGGRALRVHGADAFPFTPQRLEHLELEAKQGPWTLERLLVFHGRDFVFRRDGSKVAVSELVGKTVMLYFMYWQLIPSCKIMSPCREIKQIDDAFEVICIGFGDLDQIDDWMFALTSDDVRVDRLEYLLDVNITDPRVILLDSACRVVTSRAEYFMAVHGSSAYPFTEDHLERLEKQAEEIANEWPQKLNYHIHQHDIHRVPCDVSNCDGCYWSGNRWNFKCNTCEDFNLHEHYGFGGDNDYGKPDGRELMETFINWEKN